MMQDHLTRRSALRISALAGMTGLLGNGLSLVRKAEADEPSARRWWKEAVVYEIYPRSFKDSNGDGIGDIPGIISKLDYLKELGVNVLWLGPHYDSPNVDSGYDVRDYRKVNPEFGTMADFEALVAGLKERGMKLIVDLVVNHTSDEHVWFQESRKSKNNPYRDWYIWRDGKPDGGLPNNYVSFFGGKAWTKDDATGQYYLHYFAKKQPDLNWENPKVREACYDVMRFWLEKGVSGFRMDSILLMSKPEGLRDLTPEELKHPEFTYANGPHIHEYMHGIRRAVLAGDNLMALGETFGLTPSQTPLFIDPKRQELQMVLHFDLMRTGRDDWRVLPRTLPDMKKAILVEQVSGGPDGWPTTYLENHDNPRAVSRFGDNSPESAKALALMLSGRRGTLFMYQGQEIGMTNYPFRSIQDFDDISAKGAWEDNVPTGAVSATKMLHDLGATSRDNSRTPVQWAADPKGGFTTGKPWYHVNPDTSRINVAAQENDPASVLAFYKKVFAARAAHLELVYGQFHDADPTHPAMIAFVRGSGRTRYLVLINMTAENQNYSLPKGLTLDEVILDTAGRTAVAEIGPKFLPWQGGIYRLRNA